ncbi:MAG TPA: hypothetical protein VFA89_17145 [Terriglobales bacterium]|nr:hypothetical protein [Terriglobales bacterium]
MGQVSQDQGVDRAPRVKLGGSILGLALLENRRQLRVTLHMLSVSGGQVKIAKPLDEGIKVTLVFHIGATTMRVKVKMLFPMVATNGWLQPFQFMNLSAEDRQKLDSELNALL